MGIALLAGHANANTSDVTGTASAITVSPNMGAITDSSITDLTINSVEKISAEDALNARDIAVQKRAAEVRTYVLFVFDNLQSVSNITLKFEEKEIFEEILF